MKIKTSFWLLTVLLFLILSGLSYFAFTSVSRLLFVGVELVILFTFLYLIWLYQRVVKPIYVIGNGMELLKEQDFSSRLIPVGQSETDRIIDIFNRMMDQLKNERLHLREQNHFLDLLINASPLGVIILDLDKKIMSYNPVILKILQIKQPDRLIGAKLQDINYPLMKELGKIPLRESETIRLNNGDIFKCTHTSFVDKGFYRSFYLVEPLTLEVFIAEKETYGKVIRMISHEVNNTTAGIVSILDTLPLAIGKVENINEVSDILQIAIDRCYGMSQFITNFADLVRIPEPTLKEENLNNLVLSSKQFMENLCRNRQITLTLELDETLSGVMVDQLLFEQVLINIIKNAAESIENNGTIHIRTYDDPPCLEVIDSGKGIDEETESKLFTPFFSTKSHGQGIGLVLIREILQKHHCTFSLKTNPDGFTSFKICFPDYWANTAKTK